MIPGEIITSDGEIILNKDLVSLTMKVSNTGDRPIQVGSHYHFAEVNESLEFDRKKSLGMRLNISSGTAVRFEPGQTRDVELIEIQGLKKYLGLIKKSWEKLNEKNSKTILCSYVWPHNRG